MGDIINLRQARKSRKRVDDKSQAAANRLKYGRTKGDKRLAVLEKQRHDSIIDGARLEPNEEQGSSSIREKIGHSNGRMLSPRPVIPTAR